MGLSGAQTIAVGEKDQIYALATPFKGKEDDNTIYKWTGELWLPLHGKGAIDITVGKNGRIYIKDNWDKMFYNDELEMGIRKCKER